MKETQSLKVNGRSVNVPPGVSVAAALARAGIEAIRHSVSGQPRGPLCAMGICHECRVTVDGLPHRLGCQTFGNQNVEAASVLPQRTFDILIVGAGPAGIAAAVAAAQSGRSVGVVDDNSSWGGQIWRGGPAIQWLHRLAQSEVELLAGTRVFAQPEPKRLWAESGGRRVSLGFKRLILAVGARERFLPFPGWTLPGVMGAGGLQALVKSGLPIAERKVIVAGSGPLLLAVAAYLRSHKASVGLIAEQAKKGSVLRFGLGLVAHPSKLLQAIALKARLLGIPYHTGTWPVSATGSDRLRAVTLTNGRKNWSEQCDYLACGYGLVPNAELPALMGCRIEQGCVVVDDEQQTSVPGTYCAGEPTGIGGLECSLVEGQLAGYAASGQNELARRLLPARRRARRFAEALERAFALREELKELPAADTIVCRCEDVPLARLESCLEWREAKLQTRCGMGPCQGRVCGPALAFLRGWEVESIRPPVLPVCLGSLLGDDVTLEEPARKG
jgi:D-hydroxyproline dehydrogenase subunit alpha